jgi:KipI family sensor histidine kinase inhibitor
MPQPSPVRVHPLGDSALTVVLGEGVDLALARRVHRLARRVRDAELTGVREVVPAYGTLGVFYDPLATTHDVLATALAALGVAPDPDDAEEGTEHRILVRYDGEDLAAVAESCGLLPAEVVALHASASYTVFFLGFVPGFAYLGPLPAPLHLPRRPSPRPRVPAGSVAIAGDQTAIYPLPTPGGWHLLGHTDAPMWDPRRVPPARLAPGDRVRFEPMV